MSEDTALLEKLLEVLQRIAEQLERIANAKDDGTSTKRRS